MFLACLCQIGAARAGAPDDWITVNKDYSSQRYVDLDQILDHVKTPLVQWAFHPGADLHGTPRSKPPLTSDEFTAALKTWLDADAPCPKS